VKPPNFKHVEPTNYQSTYPFTDKPPNKWRNKEWVAHAAWTRQSSRFASFKRCVFAGVWFGAVVGGWLYLGRVIIEALYE